jgi:hypothetical protein
MSDQVLYVSILIGLLFLYRLANSTDKPKIKGIPEIPGVPLFGNLFHLGTDHARVAQKWVAKYGPVFQTRLGNKVSIVYQVVTISNFPSASSTSILMMQSSTSGSLTSRR